MKKEFIKLSGILCLITLVASLLLAGVNALTIEKIELAQKQASEAAMAKVLPSADSFEILNENISAGKKDGKDMGYCVNVLENGYGGEISFMIGIAEDGVVSGIEVLSHSETAGLGAKVTEEKFKSQFSGKKYPLTVVKKETQNLGEITAITGATITSRATAQAVSTAFEMISELKEGTK